MAPVNTGILFLQFSSLVNPHALSKIVLSALQKVDKLLYIKVKGLPMSETKVSTYNRIVNQLYNISSRNAADRFDTRVVLTDFRDSLIGPSVCDVNKLKTSHTIETILTTSLENSYAEFLENKRDGITSEVLHIDTNFKDTGIEHQEKTQNHIPNSADEDSIYDHVVIGGTFDNLHSGHKMLLSAAILRCKKSLTIGKLWELIEPCQTRIKKLQEFLVDVEPRLQYKVVPITDLYGPTADDPALQLLVVSEETQKGGMKINQLRQEKGLSKLDIYSISVIDDNHAGAGEENKISSSSFRKRLLGSHIKPPKFKSKPYVIGLTGGIASGKTTISKRLKDLGAHIISCDHLGHLAYKSGTECYRQMVEYFGVGILNEENEIDRKKLGPLVFSNKDHLERLNKMVWPEIRRLYNKEINDLKKQNFQGVIVLDAAVLLEAGWQEDCAEVWVATIPKEEQATRRVESQLSNSDRVASANVVICSIWEPEVTAAQVLKAWQYVQEFLEK
ncbi:hypothetical protein GHT06_018874 [Daphnia sinensis]|uniref:Cytidyltransferase-like domain-containing protein n=1 Tax=Daphnia sinensis TaxID=1820382 RepID=A0AAD5L4Z3_9CRUS|nr:hypothetical protein GHT06_018874 [Daphnia sinensis]